MLYGAAIALHFIVGVYGAVPVRSSAIKKAGFSWVKPEFSSSFP
jgi:hypothetical protein